VFSVQPLFISPELTPDVEPDDEVRRGKNVADAAAAAGIAHFVYASALGADTVFAGPLLRPKRDVEKHIRALGLPFTILRPVSFMENYAGSARGVQRDGTITSAMYPTIREQLIASRDIGALAAVMFDNPDRHLGEAVEIAGDELTIPEIADVISRSTGLPIRYVQIKIDDVRKRDPMLAQAYERMNEPLPRADIERMRQFHPDLMTFGAWLKAEGATKIRALLLAPR